MNLPAEYQNVSYPVLYEKAKQALAECYRVDECKGMADKAKAVAVYARQAGDFEMEKIAQRIRARAVQRMGELLKEEDARGVNIADANPNVRNSDVPRNSGRHALGASAGLSRDQVTQAVNVNNVPRPMFNSLVDSPNPPNIPQLAKIGQKPKPIHPFPPSPMTQAKPQSKTELDLMALYDGIGADMGYAKIYIDKCISYMKKWDGPLPQDNIDVFSRLILENINKLNELRSLVISNRAKPNTSIIRVK